MAVTAKKPNTKAGDHNLVDEFRQYKVSEIQIRPFIDPERPRQNMGLEKYGQVLFEGTMHEQQLRCTIVNGIVRYITGLDEFAENVKRLPEAERQAKVKVIRETVAKLNEELYLEKLDVEDEDFWSKTKLAPTNSEYWSTVNFTIGNDGLSLDPSDPHELIKIIAAEAGGFDDVAASFEEARNASNPPKFYLERRRDARIQEGKLKQIRDNAIYILFKTKMEEPQKLFWYAKNLLPIANGYKKTDPVDIWYNDLNSYIDGTGIEQDKKKAPEKFINMTMREMEYIHIRAYVLEAAFLKKIITKADNKIYNRDTGSMLGGNIEEVIEHLRQPMNQSDLDSLQNQIDPIWSR